MKKILTIGGAMQDIFLHYDSVESIYFDTETKEISYIILEEGRKIEVQKVTNCTGGGATNAARSFKKLEFDVESFFKVGYDEAGRFILDQLKYHRISVKSVVRSEHAATGNSFIIPDHKGKYAILAYRGANLLLKADDIPEQAITECDQLYITSLSKESSKVLPLITGIAKKHHKPVAVNPGTSQLTENVQTLQDALPSIDTLILNCYEAHLLISSMMLPEESSAPSFEITKTTPKLLCAPITPSPIYFSLVSYFKQILQEGPRIAVVTNGAEGVYVTDGSKIYFHPSITPKKIVTALGAGDAFGSTFVGFLLAGHTIEDAIRAGVINSASVLEHLDTTSGLESKEELENKVTALDKHLLQIFPFPR